MTNTISRRVSAFFCAVLCVLAVAGLAACSAPAGDNTAEDLSVNRQYMAEVNQVMDELSVGLQGFDDAVSREDAVSMRTQADKAFKSLDRLAAIEAPEELAEVQQDYVTGCSDLKDALSAYVDLYMEIDSATEDHPFDYSTYQQRLSDIQAAYDSGIASLQAADDLAASL